MIKPYDINQANELLSQASSSLKMLPMPTGDSDFRDIINDKFIYVDKTLLVKEILDSAEKVVLITRPRRWGKTLGLSMLKYFLSLEVDVDGKEVESNSNRQLFDGLKIAKTDKINEQGKHPVIFITLKAVKGNSYEHVEQSLRLIISQLFYEYLYLRNWIKEDSDRIKFDQIIERTASYVDLTDSMKFLSKLLLDYHHKEPYLLIDEYDVPLNNSYNTNYYSDTLSLIRNLFEAVIKDNRYIKKAIVTGVFKIAKSGLWTGMNNSSDYSILSKRYAQYFGFTESELEALLLEVGIQDAAIKSVIKDWYNGYNIGGLTIYNPWSIINFFSRLEIAPYWVNTESAVAGDRRLSTDLMITEQIHDKINLLIANFGMELTEIIVNTEVVFGGLEQDANSLWGLLLFGGYLSVETTSHDEMGRVVAQAKVPNREVLSIYNSSISIWVREKLSIDQTSFDSIGKNFDLESIKSVKTTIDRTISIYGDRIAQKNESVFHGLIQSICLLKGDKHRLASESYSGFGRIDSIFYPITGKSKTIIIHEYKIIKELRDEDQLKLVMANAIWQVYEKIYIDAPLVQNKYFEGICTEVELRAIVILCNPSVRNGFSTEIMVRNHNVDEMKTIAAAFQSSPKDKDKIAALRTEIDTEVEQYVKTYMS